MCFTRRLASAGEPPRDEGPSLGPGRGSPHQARQSDAAMTPLYRLYFPSSTHAPSTTTTPAGPFNHSS